LKEIVQGQRELYERRERDRLEYHKHKQASSMRILLLVLFGVIIGMNSASAEQKRSPGFKEAPSPHPVQWRFDRRRCAVKIHLCGECEGIHGIVVQEGEDETFITIERTEARWMLMVARKLQACAYRVQ
jgi:hypothetical protein